MPPLAASAKVSKRQQEKELAKVTIKKEDLELTVTETFPSRPAPPFPPRSEAPNSPGRRRPFPPPPASPSWPRPPARQPRGGRPTGRGGLVYGRTAQARSPGAPGAAGRPQAPPPGAASGRPQGGAGEAVGRPPPPPPPAPPVSRRRGGAAVASAEVTWSGRRSPEERGERAAPPYTVGTWGAPAPCLGGRRGLPEAGGPLPRATRTTPGDPSAPPRATFREDESPSGGAHLSHQPPRIVHNCLCQCCSKCLSVRKALPP
ncbi:unnamed protein product [Nyctereutes procyonoides]|uniref:(raccoon dog) hypothetical protein n=1 Tax=Nyctereutes procyonoides TaxID=34880 RepID=A0A811ZIP2_NYCPR|nr:unnamed protein product [Nyctereutes procyonoides]